MTGERQRTETGSVPNQKFGPAATVNPARHSIILLIDRNARTNRLRRLEQQLRIEGMATSVMRCAGMDAMTDARSLANRLAQYYGSQTYSIVAECRGCAAVRGLFDDRSSFEGHQTRWRRLKIRSLVMINDAGSTSQSRHSWPSTCPCDLLELQAESPICPATIRQIKRFIGLDRRVLAA